MGNLLDILNTILKDAALGLKGYLKSRVIIMGFVFLILSVGFLIIKAPMPYLLALLIALLDIVPILGAGIVMVPWGIISYFWGIRELGVGLIVLYVILTISKQLIEPKVLGDQIGIKPLYTFLSTIIGSLLFGPLGLILGPMLAIVINSIIRIRNMNNDKDRR